MASLVVFLVALPLCMGIAIASGVPPALGLITGIIGGLVVGFFAGQPLQVSGPAAGLAVLVWQLVQDFGLAALGLAALIGGLLQLAAGMAGLGRWFRAVSPGVIQGMLAGIGALILASQFHVMVDDSPRGTGLENLLSIPEAIYKAIFPMDGSVHQLAALVGVVTIATILLWNRFRPSFLKMLPGPLVGVIAGVLVSVGLSLPVSKVAVPDNLATSANWIWSSGDILSLLTVPAFWAAVLGLAVIASAETLLCATAVDRLHHGPRTHYDKELRAQGIGNILCGVVGALPMTGVIVRSSANVEAGGRTKWSAIFHGAWILLLVAFLPQVLALIPTSALAAILVYTGVKLLNIKGALALAAKGRGEVAIWAATLVAIVATDLLIGVATGFALALLRLLFAFARLSVTIRETETEAGTTRVDLELAGAATFVSLPKLAEALECFDSNAEVHVHLDAVTYVDHACMELFEQWSERHGGEVSLEVQRLQERSKPPSLRLVA